MAILAPVFDTKIQSFISFAVSSLCALYALPWRSLYLGRRSMPALVRNSRASALRPESLPSPSRGRLRCEDHQTCRSVQRSVKMYIHRHMSRRCGCRAANQRAPPRLLSGLSTYKRIRRASLAKRSRCRCTETRFYRDLFALFASPPTPPKARKSILASLLAVYTHNETPTEYHITWALSTPSPLGALLSHRTVTATARRTSAFLARADRWPGALRWRYPHRGAQTRAGDRPRAVSP